jgi:uncharacterized protein involved in exopolysaccharide biosynthesis
MARYIEILFRYWARFAVILVLLPIPVSIATLVYFRTYQATADLWVQDPTYFGSNTNVGSNGVAGWNQYLTPAQNEADELTQYLQTTSFLYAVGDRMAADGLADKKERDKLITSMLRNMHVTPSGSHLVVVTFSCSKASECTETLAATIAVFQDRLTQALKNQQQLSTSFLQGQLTAAQQRSASSEGALEKYLAEHPGVLVPTNGQTGIAQLDQLITQAQQDRDQVIQLQNELGQAQFTFAAADQFIRTSTHVVDSPTITAGGFLGDGSSLKRAAVVWLAAIGVAAVYLALLVWMDKTARDPRELTGRLSVPVLATIPLLPAKERF